MPNIPGSDSAVTAPDRRTPRRVQSCASMAVVFIERSDTDLTPGRRYWVRVCDEQFGKSEPLSKSGDYWTSVRVSLTTSGVDSRL